MPNVAIPNKEPTTIPLNKKKYLKAVLNDFLYHPIKRDVEITPTDIRNISKPINNIAASTPIKKNPAIKHMAPIAKANKNGVKSPSSGGEAGRSPGGAWPITIIEITRKRIEQRIFGKCLVEIKLSFYELK